MTDLTYIHAIARAIEANERTALGAQAERERERNTITVNLSWPSSKLSPNARGSWQTKEGARKAARYEGSLAARDFREMQLPDRLQLTVIYHPPDDRHRDADNVLSSLKPALDGIFQEIDRNDHAIWRVILERGPVVKGGQVVIALGGMG